MRFRRRLAELIAPPDDWSTLPPLPGPAPVDLAAPPRGEAGLGLLLRLLAESRSGGRGTTAALLRRWFDGNPDAVVDAYLPAAGRSAVVSASPLTCRLLQGQSPRRAVTELAPRDLLAPEPRSAPPGRPPSVGFDGVALVDVVGGLPASLAVRLMRRSAELARPGGVVVLVDRTNRPRWKAASDSVGRTWRLAAGHGLTPSPKPAAAWLRLMDEAGLRPQLVPWRTLSLTPWCLVVGYRPAEPHPGR